MPVLSIIIPAHNCAKYIPAALNSALYQGISDCEIIVVNDGSTDNTLSVCESFAKAHPALRLYSQENQGVSAARNFGISKATGKYLAFLDADDCFLPDCFGHNIANLLDENYDVIMFSSYSANIRRNRYQFDMRFRDGVVPGGRMYPISGTFAACLYRRELLEANQIRFANGIRLNEDQVFKLKALYSAGTIRTCSSFSYIYYTTPGSTRYTITKEYDRVDAWKEARQWFELHCTDADRRQVLNYIDIKIQSRMLLYAKSFIQSGHSQKQLLEELQRVDGLQMLRSLTPHQVMPYQANELLLFQNDLQKFVRDARLEGWKISIGRLLLHIPIVRRWRDKRQYPLTSPEKILK